MNRSVTPRLVSKRNRKRKPRPLYCVRIHDGYWPRKYPEWRSLSSVDQGNMMFREMTELQRKLNCRGTKRATVFAYNQFIEVIRVEHHGDVIVTAIPPGPMTDALEAGTN